MTTKEAERIAIGLVIIITIWAYAALFMDIQDLITRVFGE